MASGKQNYLCHSQGEFPSRIGLLHSGRSMAIHDGQVGILAESMVEKISAPQHELKPGPYGWVVEVGS